VSTPAAPPDEGGPLPPLPPPGAVVPSPPPPPVPPGATPYLPPPPPGGYAAPGGYPVAPPAPRRSTSLALLALILALIGVIPLVGLAALVLAVVALVRIRQGRAAGTGMAVVAVVLSVVWMGGTAAFLAGGGWDRVRTAVTSAEPGHGVRGSDGTIATSGSVQTQQLQVGDCFEDPSMLGLADGETTQSSTVTGIPCTQPHDFEVFAVVPVDGSDYPGDDAISTQAQSACKAAFEGFVGVAFDDSVLDVYFYTPTSQTWSRLHDRSITCSVSEGTGTTGTLRGAQR